MYKSPVFVAFLSGCQFSNCLYLANVITFFLGGGEGAFILGKLEPQQCHVTQYLLFLKVRAENFHGYSESSK